MRMLGSLQQTILTAVFACLGVVIASAWYQGREWVAWAALATVIAVAVLVHVAGRLLVTRAPLKALRAFESLVYVNGALSSITACFTILVTVKLTSLAGTADPQKELIGGLSSAITALLAGLLVSLKDSDEQVGALVKKQFQGRYGVAGADEKTKDVVLPPESPALLAVYTSYANGWVDWKAGNRRARVTAVDDFVKSRRASR